MKKIILMVIVLAGLLAGCKLPASLTGSSPNSSPASNETNTAANTATNTSSEPSNSSTGSEPGTTTSTAPTSDPKADIVRASKKFISLHSFSAKMSGTGKTDLQMDLEYVAPDRYHISHNAGQAGGVETILIGKTSYIRTGGTWQKIPIDMGSSIPNLRDSFTEEGLKLLKDVKYEGEDSSAGKPAYLYSYNSSTPDGKTSFHSRIWISKDTGLVMRIAVDYDSGDLKQMTVDYDTQTPITIEAPVP